MEVNKNVNASDPLSTKACGVIPQRTVELYQIYCLLCFLYWAPFETVNGKIPFPILLPAQCCILRTLSNSKRCFMLQTLFFYNLTIRQIHKGDIGWCQMTVRKYLWSKDFWIRKLDIVQILKPVNSKLLITL